MLMTARSCVTNSDHAGSSPPLTAGGDNLRKEGWQMPFEHETQPIAMPMVGYAYVPMQAAEMRNLFDPEEALNHGTIFPILAKPLGVYGKQVSGGRIFPEVDQHE